MRASFRTKLLFTHGLIALVTALVVAIAIEVSLAPVLENTIDRRLETQARAVARWMERARHYDRLAGRLAAVVDARVTIVGQDGTVLGDSKLPPADVSAGVILETPEVQDARTGAVGRATRRDESQGGALVRFLAVPGPNDMVVRLGVKAEVVAEARGLLRPRLVLFATVSFAIAVLLAVFMARTLSRRIARMREVAEQLGRGDYDLPPPSDATDEIGVLSRTLSMSADKLRQLDEMRREFLANAAHELRTPVTSIRGYAETLMEDGPAVDADARREFVSTIHRNAMRISRLVDGLLQLQSFEAQSRTQRPLEEVPLAPVVRGVEKTLAKMAEESSVALVVEVPDGLVVDAYPDELEQVLTNLAENAIKYGGEGTVKIAARADGRHVYVTVEDGGPGIAPDAQERLFERFYRVDKGRTRKAGGSGLGLAIVKEFVEAMDGEVSVSSQPGSTVFTVRLRAA